MIDSTLLQKYNVAVPRYTSYPTVSYWKEDISVSDWKDLFSERFRTENKTNGISLYIHLPFCESLCTYCGCNKKITTNHSVEEVYIQAILEEWSLYRSLMVDRPLLCELHLGGGTPTFFSSENINKLIKAILQDCDLAGKYEFSIEGHPNNTTHEHLQTLHGLGFRRISYGVQDNDPEVQKVINRIQPFSNVQLATKLARDIGFESVNFDLIYGLPLQTVDKMRITLQQCISLRPDRVAFYSYAHVPWTSRGQRLFDEGDLPDTDTKMQLYLLGKEMFAEAGYSDIGMDHFSLPGDELIKARDEHRLHRNFMGYTTQHTSFLIGLGVSAISDIGTGFAQNDKKLSGYYEAMRNGELPIVKGWFLSDEDVAFRKYILDISCKGQTTFLPGHSQLLMEIVFPELLKYKLDGFLDFNDSRMWLTPLGRNFIRNICSAFDLHLQRGKMSSTKDLFSKAI